VAITYQVENLQAISRIPACALGFACQKLKLDAAIYLVGANAAVKETFRSVDILGELTVLDAYDAIVSTQPG
jgi:hypothetical protein